MSYTKNYNLKPNYLTLACNTKKWVVGELEGTVKRVLLMKYIS